MPTASAENNVKQVNGSQEKKEHRKSNETHKWAKDNSKQLPWGE